MTSLTRLAAAALAGLAVAAAATAACAQSPVPIGFWTTADGSEQLLITQSAQCSLADAQGRPVTSGPCSWNSSYGGGILTIMSSQTYTPSPVYYNVVWVNQTTIKVEGDVFYKRQ